MNLRATFFGFLFGCISFYSLFVLERLIFDGAFRFDSPSVILVSIMYGIISSFVFNYWIRHKYSSKYYRDRDAIKAAFLFGLLFTMYCQVYGVMSWFPLFEEFNYLKILKSSFSDSIKYGIAGMVVALISIKVHPLELDNMN